MRTALITLQPVRRPTSAQYDGPSSPWSCTCESWSASACAATSSSVAFTNTPTSATRRRIAAAIPATTAGSAARGEPRQRMKPSAHAPSSTASSASSGRVMPQILTRVTPESVDGAGPGLLDGARPPERARAVAQRDPQRAGQAARAELHVEDVAGRAPGEDLGDV